MDADSIDELLDELYSDDVHSRATIYAGYALAEIIRELNRIANQLERDSPSLTVKPDPTTLSEIFRKENDSK